METFISLFNAVWPWLGLALLTLAMLAALGLWICLCEAGQPRCGPDWLGEAYRDDEAAWEDEDGRLRVPMNREGGER